ncbi:hypothetical protein JZO70_17185 [Enterococcus sp. 669A]|uniref:ABC transporter Uup C-terminal domain-containing protein n=1 Tax=Candidatus Enterococcus moelleringii TaxID=2815325 RepID=A0ABS3LE52_9ENTE|nr:hypothetical protein [Enterococcus sp. 669A]MBO1307912.1 hypothetical protein [Enterococcus sp. 669A]
MNELTYENNLTLLGQLRDQLQRLEDTDYMTAYYKGYSSSGATLEEIKDEIQELQEQIKLLEEELDDFSW